MEKKEKTPFKRRYPISKYLFKIFFYKIQRLLAQEL